VRLTNLKCEELAKPCQERYYVDVSLNKPFDKTKAQWQLLGKNVESLTNDITYEQETKTDILCQTKTITNSVTETITLDNFNLVGCNELYFILLERIKTKTYDFSFPLMIVKEYLKSDDNTKAIATVYTMSDIKLNSHTLGENKITGDISIILGGEVIDGVATKELENPIFTIPVKEFDIFDERNINTDNV